MGVINNEFGLIEQSLDSDNAAIDVEIDPADNEIVTINAIYASFDGNVAAAELTIEEATTEVFKRSFDDGVNIEPGIAISFAKGATVNVKLTASGTGGTTGSVVVIYNKASVGQ